MKNNLLWAVSLIFFGLIIAPSTQHDAGEIWKHSFYYYYGLAHRPH